MAKMLELKIETTDSNLTSAIKDLFLQSLECTTIDKVIETFNSSNLFFSGRGGSHIWVSNNITYDRVAIITGTSI